VVLLGFPPPVSSRPVAARNHGRWLVAALGVAAAAAGVVRAVDLTWLPHGIPSFDVADYVNQALRYRDALAAGRFGDVGALLLVPNVHPPVHALALGAWLAASGGAMAAACAFEVLLFAFALALLVWVGHRADPVSGRWAGLGAAAVTAWSTEHQRLAAAPMTENLALVAALVAVGVAIPVVSRLRDDVGAFLLAGGAVCVAGLVRWNLAPMLLVPFVLAAVVEARSFAQARDARIALLAAPSFFTVVAWERFRPGLFSELAAFFRNVDSGLDPTSAENLTWVPRTLAGSGYLGAPVAVGVGALFVAGLVHAWAARLRPPPDDAPLRAIRLVQLVALVGLTAIAVHPYKLERVLHGTVPVLVLGALLPLARAATRAPSTGRFGAAALVGLAVAALVARSGPAALPRPELLDRPADTAILDAVVAHTRSAVHLVISGNHPRINRHNLELWRRLAGRDVGV
ncbi:MAG: hypothetical protein ACK4YP_24495, partial [Myxococcota bacterium]